MRMEGRHSQGSRLWAVTSAPKGMHFPAGTGSALLTAASSGDQVPLWRQSCGWVLQSVCCISIMPVTFSSLLLACSHCCATPVALLQHRQVTGDSGLGKCPLTGGQQPCSEVPSPAEMLSSRAIPLHLLQEKLGGGGLGLGGDPSLARVSSCSHHEAPAAPPPMSQRTCPHHHLPAPLPSAPLTCRPTRLLCSLMREWMSR